MSEPRDPTTVASKTLALGGGREHVGRAGDQVGEGYAQPVADLAHEGGARVLRALQLALDEGGAEALRRADPRLPVRDLTIAQPAAVVA